MTRCQTTFFNGWEILVSVEPVCLLELWQFLIPVLSFGATQPSPALLMFLQDIPKPKFP